MSYCFSVKMEYDYATYIEIVLFLMYFWWDCIENVQNVTNVWFELKLRFELSRFHFRHRTGFTFVIKSCNFFLFIIFATNAGII